MTYTVLVFDPALHRASVLQYYEPEQAERAIEAAMTEGMQWRLYVTTREWEPDIHPEHPVT